MSNYSPLMHHKQFVAYDILFFFIFNYLYFSEKISLDVSCELSAKQTIHMKCQDLFSPSRHLTWNVNLFLWKNVFDNVCWSCDWRFEGSETSLEETRVVRLGYTTERSLSVEFPDPGVGQDKPSMKPNISQENWSFWTLFESSK